MCRSRRSARCLVASHDGPAHLSMRLDSLDQTRATRMVTQPNGVQVASDSAVPDVQDGVTRLAFQSAGGRTCSARWLLGALVFRRMSRVAICGGIALVVVAGQRCDRVRHVPAELDRGAASTRAC